MFNMLNVCWIARLAERFMSIKSEEGKAMAILGDRWGPWDVGVILRLFVPGRPMLDRPDNGKGKGIGGSRGVDRRKEQGRKEECSMGAENVKKFHETIARIISKREEVKVTVKVRKKEVAA